MGNKTYHVDFVCNRCQEYLARNIPVVTNTAFKIKPCPKCREVAFNKGYAVARAQLDKKEDKK